MLIWKYFWASKDQKKKKKIAVKCCPKGELDTKCIFVANKKNSYFWVGVTIVRLFYLVYRYLYIYSEILVPFRYTIRITVEDSELSENIKVCVTET